MWKRNVEAELKMTGGTSRITVGRSGVQPTVCAVEVQASELLVHSRNGVRFVLGLPVVIAAANCCGLLSLTEIDESPKLKRGSIG